jgi:hypothetical protein
LKHPSFAYPSNAAVFTDRGPLDVGISEMAFEALNIGNKPPNVYAFLAITAFVSNKRIDLVKRRPRK